MNGPVLITPRLTLTPVQLSDYDELAVLWADETFTRHISGRALSGEEVWFRLLRDLGHWQALGHGNWTMRLTETQAYVGSVGVLNYRRAVEPPMTDPELGWGLSPAFQGQGLAGEGLSAALDWVDMVLKAPRSVCMIGPANVASVRLAERAGFVPYAEGTYHDQPTILLERLRP